MTIKRVSMLAAILIAATFLVCLSRGHRPLRHIRVAVEKTPNRPETELAQAKKYLRDACPDMTLINDQLRADYKVNAVWNRAQGWIVLVSRKDLPFMFDREGTDAMEAFRQTCTAIRDDAKEVEDFDASTQSMPVGRYLLHSATADHILLLDTKTGAVWELKPVPLGNSQAFDRISVEGLYNNLAGVGP